MPRSVRKPKYDVMVQATDTDMFVVIDGLRIAMRGKPGTPQARTWVALEPGWEVWDEDDMNVIAIRYNGTRIH